MNTCGCCGRELAGVAQIFTGAPAVCGRADCLGWAREQARTYARALRIAGSSPASLKQD